MIDKRIAALKATTTTPERARGIRLNNLKIRNFRFFGDKEEALIFDNKHVLLYGENGSGKSSVFRALELLARYPLNKEILAKHHNIFNAGAPMTVCYEFANGKDLVFDDDHWEVSDNLGFVKTIPVFRPFLDFKSLLKIHFTPVGNGDAVNLFEFFKALLADYPIGGDQTLKSITDANEYLKKIGSVLNDDLLPSINEIIKKFDASIVIERFDFKQELSAPPKATMQVSFAGQSVEYHQFLNEARLSALAIGVYFAAIRHLADSVKESTLKILVLDDLLISLDMSNRLALWNILESDFVPDFQVFFFTHDRALFEMVKGRVDLSDWTTIEMYVDDREGGEKPYIMPSLDYFQKAEKHIIEKDYPAAATYLRRELEKLLKKAACDKPCDEHATLEGLAHQIEARESIKEILSLATTIAKSPDVSLGDSVEEKKFQKAIKKLKEKVAQLETSTYSIGETKKLLERLFKFKSYILNPQSHDDTNKPLFRKELDEAVKQIKELGKMLDKSRYARYELEYREITEKKRIEAVRSKYDESPYRDQFVQFEKDIEVDFRESGTEKPDAGYFQLTMFPVQRKKRFSSRAAIKDTFNPVSFPHHSYPMPTIGSDYFSDHCWHGFFGKGASFFHSSIFEDGQVIVRHLFVEDVNGDRSKDAKRIILFPSIIDFVTKSFMLAKAFYEKQALADEEIAIKITMADIADRRLEPPKYNNWSIMAPVDLVSKTANMEERRVHRYQEISKDYLELAKSVIDEFFVTFQWPGGIHVIDDFQKDLDRYFK